MRSTPARWRVALAAASVTVLATALVWTGVGTATAATPGTIVGQQSGRCVDVASGSTANGAVVQVYDCNGTGAQQWQVGTNGTITNPQSGRCLDISGGSTANGARVQIYDCNGTGAQQW